jgi:hypothetical protein
VKQINCILELSGCPLLAAPAIGLSGANAIRFIFLVKQIFSSFPILPGLAYSSDARIIPFRTNSPRDCLQYLDGRVQVRIPFVFLLYYSRTPLYRSSGDRRDNFDITDMESITIAVGRDIDWEFVTCGFKIRSLPQIMKIFFLFVKIREFWEFLKFDFSFYGPGHGNDFEITGNSI